MAQRSPLIPALFTISLFLTFAVMQSAAQSSRPPAGNPTASNPLKIAQLDWYQANITTNFEVGNEPEGVAFDGANMWIAAYNKAIISKF